jgi:hypothetical protein
MQIPKIYLILFGIIFVTLMSSLLLLLSLHPYSQALAAQEQAVFNL